MNALKYMPHVTAIEYNAMLNKLYNVLVEINSDTNYVVYKKHVKLYLGIDMYNIAKLSTTLTNVVYGMSYYRKIEFLLDIKLDTDNYAFTRHDNIITSITDL
jgi:hypothetical protein